MRRIGALALTLTLLVAGWSAAAADPPAISEVRVYIHYHRPSDRPVVDAVADVLGALDYRVIDKRLVTQPTAGDVRFFHAADRTAAIDVKKIVETCLSSRSRSGTLKLLDRRGRFAEARPGLVEVWIPPDSYGLAHVPR